MRKDKFWGMQCIELVPGANTYVVPEEEPEPQPPEGFVDTRVKLIRKDPATGEEEVYKILSPDGKEVLWEKGEKGMARYDDDLKRKLLANAKYLLSEGKSLCQVAKEIGVPAGTLHYWLSKEKQAQGAVTFDPAEVKISLIETVLAQYSKDIPAKEKLTLIKALINLEIQQSRVKEEDRSKEEEEEIPAAILKMAKKAGMTEEDFLAFVQEKYGKVWADLYGTEKSEIIKHLHDLGQDQAG